MSVIINFRWEIKPEKHTEFLNLMGQAVTVTKIFDACPAVGCMLQTAKKTLKVIKQILLLELSDVGIL